MVFAMYCCCHFDLRLHDDQLLKVLRIHLEGKSPSELDDFLYLIWANMWWFSLVALCWSKCSFATLGTCFSLYIYIYILRKICVPWARGITRRIRLITPDGMPCSQGRTFGPGPKSPWDFPTVRNPQVGLRGRTLGASRLTDVPSRRCFTPFLGKPPCPLRLPRGAPPLPPRKNKVASKLKL